MQFMTGMKSWLGVGEPQLAHQELNLLGAAEAHVLWKARLGHHVAGSTREPLENVLVGQGGYCQLGCWIEGPELAPYRELPEFASLVESHRRFHHCGGQIVDKLRSGDRAAARELFGGEYSRTLHAMLQALSGISKKMRE